MIIPDLSIAIDALKQGEVIAYPSEAVFGLGCDYRQESAVQHILRLKQRSIDKGLLLVAADWQQIAHLVADVTDTDIQKALQTWPGPQTWIFPASQQVPVWIRGQHNSVALRISAHPIVQALCQQFGAAIVSTSANIASLDPARSVAEVNAYFTSDELSTIVDGALGDLAKPTPIRDVLSGEVLRN